MKKLLLLTLFALGSVATFAQTSNTATIGISAEAVAQVAIANETAINIGAILDGQTPAIAANGNDLTVTNAGTVNNAGSFDVTCTNTLQVTFTVTQSGVLHDGTDAVNWTATAFQGATDVLAGPLTCNGSAQTVDVGGTGSGALTVAGGGVYTTTGSGQPIIFTIDYN